MPVEASKASTARRGKTRRSGRTAALLGFADAVNLGALGARDLAEVAALHRFDRPLRELGLDGNLFDHAAHQVVALTPVVFDRLALRVFGLLAVHLLQHRA